MAGLLYFVPGKTTGVHLKEVREAGLGYAFEREPTGCGVPGKGPGGASGIVLADAKGMQGKRVGYYADKQVWRKVPGTEAWVGCYTDERPGPETLARERLLAGHWVKLGDGQQWLAPVARAVAEHMDKCGHYNALPSGTDVDENGEWVEGGTLPQYAGLWDLAGRWFDSVVSALGGAAEIDGGLKVAFDFAGINDAAVTALAANYRLGKAEVGLLGLFDATVVREVLNALIDWPSIAELSQKKRAASASDGSSTGDGPVAGPPATDPP